MKKVLPLVGLAGLLLASCATVHENIDARAYLARCKYQFAGLAITGVTFTTGTIINTVNTEVFVKVTDPTHRDVALDHAQFAFYLDNNHVLDAAHQRFVRIPAGTSHTAEVAADIPFPGVVKSLGHPPKVLQVRAKLWVTLLVGKSNWVTPIVIPITVNYPIPYNKIDQYVAQRQKQLEQEAATRIANSVRTARPPLKMPSVTAPAVKAPPVSVPAVHMPSAPAAPRLP